MVWMYGLVMLLVKARSVMSKADPKNTLIQYICYWIDHWSLLQKWEGREVLRQGADHLCRIVVEIFKSVWLGACVKKFAVGSFFSVANLIICNIRWLCFVWEPTTSLKYCLALVETWKHLSVLFSCGSREWWTLFCPFHVCSFYVSNHLYLLGWY